MTIETKYNIGDKVFYILEDTICKGIVIEIRISKIGNDVIYLYHIGKDGTYNIFSEDYIFPTKEELLKSL